ncbi:MAG: hypothetical protein D8M52_07740 [Chlorobi bacterium]|nr:hypothetical protein [Chlorobiota bacterium]MCC6332234.1 tetratricopeptide repeat protein [Ignavibacteria bacterium]WKZ77444.1 MAG: adenylate/guanylate cyclase domain-containing protein [Candidatus Kapabacteria bacterium]MBV6462788.1 hypothetical protein [Chlorobiota bacterium]MCL4277502.1 tetratricopeptide repeat protein [Ignavibacteria bacterium]
MNPTTVVHADNILTHLELDPQLVSYYDPSISRTTIQTVRSGTYSAPDAIVQAVFDVLQADVELGTGSSPGLIDRYSLAMSVFEQAGEYHAARLVELRIADAAYLGSQFSLAARHYTAVVDYFRNTGDNKYLGYVLESFGIVQHYLGDFGRAERLLVEAERMWELCGAITKVTSVRVNLANLHLDSGNFATAEEYYKEAIQGFETSGDEVRRAMVATNLGILFIKQTRFAEAAELFYGALDVFQRHDKVEYTATVLGAIGNTHEAAGNPTMAISWYKQALDCGMKLGNANLITEKSIQLGEVLTSVCRFDEALYHLEQAATLCITGADYKGLCTVNTQMAMVFLGTGNTDEAWKRISEAAAYASDQNWNTQLVLCKLVSAQIAIEIGDDERALGLLRSIEEVAASLRTEYELVQILNLQYLLHKKYGQFPDALRYLERYRELNEKILGLEKQRNLAMVEVKLRFEAQQREHALALQEEQRVREQQRILLENMVPATIAERLLNGEAFIAEQFDDVSVLFFDIVNFTQMAASTSPAVVIDFLNILYKQCDEAVARHGLTKIKTLGDSYMTVAGAPVPQNDHVERMVGAALELQRIVSAFADTTSALVKHELFSEKYHTLKVRFGVHCGPVSAGVIGEIRMVYDVWGDTVNVAARLEQTAGPGELHVSDQFRKRVLEIGDGLATFTSRGKREMKGKGMMQTWTMTAPSA